MKRTIKIVRIIALVAVMGFSMSACGDDPPDGDDQPFPKPKNGTWWNDGGMLYFNNSTFIYRYVYDEFSNSTGYKGTIAFNEAIGTFTVTVTDSWSSNSWIGTTDSISGSYSVSGNTLTIDDTDDVYDDEWTHYPVPAGGSVTIKPQDGTYTGSGENLVISSSGTQWQQGAMLGGPCVFLTTDSPGFFHNKETGYSRGYGSWYTTNNGTVLVIPFHIWGNANLTGTWIKE